MTTEAFVTQVVSASRAYIHTRPLGGEYNGPLMVSTQSALTQETGRANLERVVESVEPHTIIDGLTNLWKQLVPNMQGNAFLDYLLGIFDGSTSQDMWLTYIQATIRVSCVHRFMFFLVMSRSIKTK